MLRPSGSTHRASPLVACDDNRPKEHHTLLEVINVKGACYEDHVRQPADYAGQIVRWQTDETKIISTYGFVSQSWTAAQAMDEAVHPSVYHTPIIVQLMEIDIDTNAPQWTIHGVSDRGENEHGYNSTCELDVTKRGKELNDPFRGQEAGPKQLRLHRWSGSD